MLNEPLFEVFIDVFMKRYKFILWQIVNGFKWRLHSFHKINDIVVWLMFGQGDCIFLLNHILEFLVLGRDFMWTWFNIWWRKNVNKKCIFYRDNFHESFCSNKQKLGAIKPFCTTKVSLLLQMLHASDKGFIFQGLVLWFFKMKTPCMPIHSLIM